jgi:hypothetical protein
MESKENVSENMDSVIQKILKKEAREIFLKGKINSIFIRQTIIFFQYDCTEE